MSFPTLFASSYQLYKQNTDRIARWLLEAAQLCGYDHAKSRPSKSQDNGATKHKSNSCGDSDTEKQQTDNRSPNKENKASPVYRIGVSDFIGLASIIANNPSSTVPPKVLHVIQQTIDLRKAYALFYEKGVKEDIDIALANSRHMYFVNVLKEVLLLLQTIPTQTKVYGTKRQKSDNTKKPTVLENRFSKLDFDFGTPTEHAPIVESNQKVVVFTSTEPKWELTQQIQYEPDDMDLEFNIAVYCLFDDLHALDGHLTQVWADYKSGDLDLSCASLITNTAFELVKRAESDLIQTFPALAPRGSHCQPLCTFYFTHFAHLRGLNAYEKQEPHHLFNYAMIDVAQRFYIPTCLTLQGFCHDMQPGFIPKRLPVSISGYIPKEKPCECCGGPSLADSLILDRIATLQILIEVGPLISSDNGAFTLDEVISEIRIMYATRQVSVFLAFAMQVLLDVQDNLGTQLVGPFHQLQLTARTAQSSIKTVLSTAIPSRRGNQAQRNSFFRTLQAIEQCILLDVLCESRKSIFGPRNDEPDLGPYYLLSRQPIICGLLKLAVTVRMRSHGEILAFTSGSLLSVAHLYNALRKSSALILPWPDMNLFICIQTPAKLFVGNIPQDPVECYIRYHLSLGVSAQNLSKERISGAKNQYIQNGGCLVMSGKGPRNWTYRSPLVEMLEQRFLVRKPRTDKMIYHVQALFAAETRSQQASGPKALTRFEGNSRTRYTQLSRALQDVMCRESHALEFDYIAMHFRCLKLLRRLRAWLAEETASLSECDFDESRNQLPSITEFIMQQIIVAQDDPGFCISGLGSSGTVTVVDKAASIMSQIIREEGSAEIDKLDYEIEFCRD